MDLYKNMLSNASIYRIFYINPLGSEQLQIAFRVFLLFSKISLDFLVN
jgi:hypothetical protein